MILEDFVGQTLPPDGAPVRRAFVKGWIGISKTVHVREFQQTICLFFKKQRQRQQTNQSREGGRQELSRKFEAHSSRELKRHEKNHGGNETDLHAATMCADRTSYPKESQRHQNFSPVSKELFREPHDQNQKRR